MNERFDKNIDTKTKLVTENDVANEAVTTSSTNDAVPVFSTPQEVTDFNNWYEEQLASKSTKPKVQNPNETQDGHKYLSESVSPDPECSVSRSECCSCQDTSDTKTKTGIKSFVTDDNGGDRYVKRDTAVYMNAETVLLMVLTVFSITNCISVKLPKFYPSPDLSSTPFLNPNYSSVTAPVPMFQNFLWTSLKVIASTRGKLVDMYVKAMICSMEMADVGKSFGVKSKEAAKGAMWNATAFLLRKVGGVARGLDEKVGNLLGEDIQDMSDMVVKNLECEDSGQAKQAQKVIEIEAN